MFTESLLKGQYQESSFNHGSKNQGGLIAGRSIVVLLGFCSDDSPAFRADESFLCCAPGRIPQMNYWLMM